MITSADRSSREVNTNPSPKRQRIAESPSPSLLEASQSSDRPAARACASPNDSSVAHMLQVNRENRLGAVEVEMVEPTLDSGTYSGERPEQSAEKSTGSRAQRDSTIDRINGRLQQKICDKVLAHFEAGRPWCSDYATAIKQAVLGDLTQQIGWDVDLAECISDAHMKLLEGRATPYALLADGSGMLKKTCGLFPSTLVRTVGGQVFMRQNQTSEQGLHQVEHELGIHFQRCLYENQHGEVVESLNYDAKKNSVKLVLGAGKFARVRAVSDFKTGEYFALKILAFKPPTLRRIEREIALGKKADSDRMVCAQDYSVVQGKLYVMMPLARGVEGFDYYCKYDSHVKFEALALTAQKDYAAHTCAIYESDSTPIKRLKLDHQISMLAIFEQIVLLVSQLHEKGISHRDLKLENIMIEEHDGQPIVRLVDFMDATEQTQNEDNTACGSLAYAAPEVIDLDADYALQPTDIFSLGVILTTLLQGAYGQDLARPQMRGADASSSYQRRVFVVKTPLMDIPLEFGFASGNNSAAASSSGSASAHEHWRFDGCLGIPRAAVRTAKLVCAEGAVPNAHDLLYRLLPADPTERETAQQVLNAVRCMRHDLEALRTGLEVSSISTLSTRLTGSID